MKKKNIFVIVAVICVVAFAATIATVGGGKKPGETTPSTSSSTNQPATSTSTNQLVDIVQKMENALDNILNLPADETSEEPAFMAEVDEMNGYDVVTFEETDAGAIATVKVYAPDLYSVVKKLDSDGVVRTEEELITAICNAVKDAELVEKQLELEFEKTEDGYSPVLTAEFLDALYGGVFRMLDDLLDSE